MGILKTLSLSHKRESNGNYTILMQKNPATNQPCLLFEAGTIVGLAPDEASQVRLAGGHTKLFDAYACLGMLQYAYEGSKEILFLVIVTGCASVGKIQTSEIFCITDVVLLSMRNGPDDHQMMKELRSLLVSGCFYFSHSSMANQAPYDLTLNAQRAAMTTTTDNRFFWNRLLHRHFDRFGIDTSTWLVKVLCGGITITTVYIGGLQAKACTISRLSCERAGTRFNVRGVNDLGHVANFVETEQVIFLNQSILSYLIIRGSIPLFWEQPGIQVGAHRIKMSRGSEISQSAYDKHMFLLKERFDKVVLLNLLSSGESELALNQLFNLHHEASRIGAEFPFINFDYHNLCSPGHTENLERLYQYELDKYCDQFGFFHSERGEVQRIQTGVIRTNCLDCLDRTNGVQSFIGLKMLERLVRCMDRVDILKVLPRLEDVYETSWRTNGHQISQIYTGTDALDGTNLLKDGTRSVRRTFQNNFFDGDKQSAIDILILGRTLNRDYSYRAASLLPHYYLFASPTILVNMCDNYLDYCVPEKIRVAVATWNVNGGRHFDNIMHNRARPVSDWLVDYRSNVEEGDLLSQSCNGDPIDVYVIGFQEIVGLTASNIVASSTQNQRDWLIEIQRTISRDQQYLLVTSVQLVGVCLFVFIRAKLAPHIKDVCNDQVKTGMRCTAGNKGGVAVRFRYKASSLCFVCAHFAAGQNQVKERNDDYAEITRRIQFPMGRSINSHDYVFWCGDFNYRLDKISNDEVRRAAAMRDYKTLLQCDQLKLSQAAGQTFKNYIEGDITFAPTYKYDVQSKDYDTSEKCRVPAYTDRILFKKRHPTRPNEELTDPDQILFYNRIELMSSDHRPVIAEFEIEVLNVDKAARSRVFDAVLDDCGPPDATVFVKVDGHLDVADEAVFAAILEILADEAGEIVLVRYVHSSLMIIFSDGKTAVKALELNGCPLGDHLPDNKLIISLRTNNWHQVIRGELMSNIDNTTNLVTGHGPGVHLEDDEDEAAQELDMSIGPEADLESILLNHDVFMLPDSNNTRSNEMLAFPAASARSSRAENNLHVLGRSPDLAPPSPSRAPQSPRHKPLLPPSRPPPPPPTASSASTNARSMHMPSQSYSGFRPASKDIGNSTGSTIREGKSLDAFGFAALGKMPDEVSDFGDTTFGTDQSSIDLLELSTSIDYDEQLSRPPPTMAPPTLPPLTPSRLPPALPPASPIGRLPATPSRVAPPPPIPSRSQDNNSAPRTADL